MAMKRVYRVHGGRVRGESSGGVSTTYLTDALGSVTATVDRAGSVINTYRHKPYGGLLARTGTGDDPRYLWTGDTGSRTTGLAYGEQYNRARHYGSRQASWTSADPLWPDESAYGYVNGNPMTWTDPSGEKAVEFSGKGTCYCGAEGFENCCTACNTCFDSTQQCGPYVALFPKARTALGCSGSGCCGIKLVCISVDRKVRTKRVEVTVADTGSQEGDFIIDFGCCFAKYNGIPQAARWKCSWDGKSRSRPTQLSKCPAQSKRACDNCGYPASKGGSSCCNCDKKKCGRFCGGEIRGECGVY